MAKKNLKDVETAMGIEEYKPHIEITKKLYPDIDKLKVDDVINMSIKVKVKRISRDEWGDKKLHASGTIEDADSEDYED